MADALILGDSARVLDYASEAEAAETVITPSRARALDGLRGFWGVRLEARMPFIADRK